MKRKTYNAQTNAAEDAHPPPLLRAVKIGRLDTISGWRREIGKIYRQARRNEIPGEMATKLTFIANIGVQVVKYEQELRELVMLREQLQQLRDQGFVQEMPSTMSNLAMSASPVSGEVSQ